MKKQIRFALACAACVLCMSGISALDGRIGSITGKVQVLKSGVPWAPAEVGDVLAAGDVISTGFKSSAVLTIGKSVIKVNPLSRLTIEQLFTSSKGDVSSVYLDVGSIRANVKSEVNKRVGFKVKTPVAVASVRGTQGIVFADGRIQGLAGKWCISAPEPKNIVSDVKEEDAEKFDFKYPSEPGTVYVKPGEQVQPAPDGKMNTPQQTAVQVSAPPAPAAGPVNPADVPAASEKGKGIIVVNVTIPKD